MAKNTLRIIRFKDKYKKFLEAMNYINKNSKQLEQDPDKWKIIKHNFKIKYDQPLDAAWNSLALNEKVRFDTLYKLNRVSADKDFREINRLAKIFNGKVINYGEKKEKGE